MDTNESQQIVWLDDGYNYLAIGNSITSHVACDYWWNDGVGMAATKKENDYVHLISSTLPEHSKVYAYNFYTWEIQSTDRSETLDLLDEYLSYNLNLVTIQLSENVSDTSTFESDYIELLEYIRKSAPNAQIVVIDDFWDDEKSMLKEKVANEENVDFISLKDIRGKSEYMAGLGTVVYDDEDNEHIIEHDGVAMHPGDEGMKFIADAVIDTIKK